MIDNTELQRLMRIRRLFRQIADDLNRDQAFQTHGSTYGCEHGLPGGAPRYMSEPTSGKGASSAAGGGVGAPVTFCPPAHPPEPDRGDALDLIDGGEVEVTWRPSPTRL